MHKVRGCFAFNDSAKKTCLLHGFNLALLGAILCTTLLATASALQNPTPTDSSAVKRTELLSYEGQTVSCVEVAGRPDLDAEEFTPVLALHAGETFFCSEREVIKLEYQTTPRVSVSGVRDQNGGFAFDVRIRKTW